MTFLATVAALICLSTASAFAGGNLIINGDFNNFTLNGTASNTSYQLSNIGNTGVVGAVLTGWGNYGYGWVFTPGSADTTGAATPQYNNSTYIWGPGGGVGAPTYSNNGLTTTSPNGGNYVVEDGGFNQGILYQTLTGLSVGTNYLLSFYWAAAQQYSFTGATQESWNVYWADASNTVTAQYATMTDNTPSKGFSPWQQQFYVFAATTTTESLAFLAVGTPSGQPPFSLLDGVSLVAAPEPSSGALLGAGLAALLFVGRRLTWRRQPLR